MENHSRFFPIVLSMYFPELRMELSNNITKKSNGFDVIYPIWVDESNLASLVDERNNLRRMQERVTIPIKLIISSLFLLDLNLALGIQNIIGHRKA